MMRVIFTMLLGVLFMAMSACSQPADSDTANENETEAASEATSSEGETLEVIAASTPPACVMPVPQGATCVRDINICGNSNSCTCDAGYIYNAAIGMCTLDLAGVSQAVQTDIPNGACVTDPPPDAICLRDINVCGFPSQCTCQEGFAWNDVAGKCVKTL